MAVGECRNSMPQFPYLESRDNNDPLRVDSETLKTCAWYIVRAQCLSLLPKPSKPATQFRQHLAGPGGLDVLTHEHFRLDE